METLRQRFERQTRSGDTGCIEWTGGKFHYGHGAISIKHKTYKAHRVAYEIYVGPIPIGMNVCHHCDNPACVNPKHLFLGTQKDNMSDAARKGRMRKGADHPRYKAKLTEPEVRELREQFNAGFSRRKLARKFGIHVRTMYDIACGKTYSHIK